MYVSVFLRQLHLCPSDRRTSSLGVGLEGRFRGSVGVVLFVVCSLLRHRTSSLDRQSHILKSKGDSLDIK